MITNLAESGALSSAAKLATNCSCRFTTLTVSSAFSTEIQISISISTQVYKLVKMPGVSEEEFNSAKYSSKGTGAYKTIADFLFH